MLKHLRFTQMDLKTSCIQHLVSSIPPTITTYFDKSKQQNVESVSGEYKRIVERIETKATTLLNDLCKTLSPKKTCADKCMEAIRPKNVERCSQVWKKGPKVQKCSISKVKGLCRLNCVQGFKNCQGKNVRRFHATTV